MVDAQVAFGRYFGKLEGNPNLKNAFLDCPEVLELAAEQSSVADEWHTDITFQENPALMSIRYLGCVRRLSSFRPEARSS